MENENSNREVVLVTGSSGLIGTALCRKLAQKYNVVGLDRNPPEKAVPGVDFLSLDISSEINIRQALDQLRRLHGEKIASVVHLAAYYSFSGEDSPLYKKITVDGTRHLLRQLRKFALDQFVFASTMLVHAPAPAGRKIEESSPVRPGWPYPRSKAEAENVLHEERGDVRVVNLRISGVYTDRCNSIPLANHIARIYERQVTSHLFPGNREHGQAYLHLDDLVEAIAKTIERRDRLPEAETLLLGEPASLSFEELQGKIAYEIFGQDWKTVHVPGRLAKIGAWLRQKTPFMRRPFIQPWMIDFADENYTLDIHRAQKVLNWIPRHSLARTLPKMIAALKADPHGWYRDNKLQPPRNEPLLYPRLRTQMTLPHFLNLILGLFIISNPTAWGYQDQTLAASDVLSGAGVILSAGLSLVPAFYWARWITCAIGFWLLLAPLVFWAAEPAAYASNTLLGSLVVFLSAYQPSLDMQRFPGKDIPQGWSYNPSSWTQRLPIIALAVMGFLMARYLAAFQLEYIPAVWEPFFGRGTEKILTSEVSRAFPVSDAGLGAFSYILDAVTGGIGGRRRWKTMPWMVILFGLMIIPPGVTSIILVILQPVAVGAWCTVCLMTAAIMLLMVPPVIDEVYATLQYLIECRRQGKPVWRIFWKGESIADSLRAEEVPPPPAASRPFPAPAPLLLTTAALGVWMLFAPGLMPMNDRMSDYTHLIGALVVTFGVISSPEAGRPFRYILAPLGLWYIGVSLAFGGDHWLVLCHGLTVGTLVSLLCLPEGKITKRFGLFDAWVHWRPWRRRTREA